MTGAQFQIRVATHSDVRALRFLIERSVRHLQRNDYTPAQIEGALGHALGLGTQLIDDGTYFAAFPISKSALIVGCGGWSYRKTLFGSDHGPNRETSQLDPAWEPAKIRAIFVDPDWARQGVGTLILRHCENAALRAGFHSLEMGSTLTGVPLYALHGYEQRETIAIPLPNGEVLPIVHMVKSRIGKSLLCRFAAGPGSWPE
jgi:GNAT superfamily N-acetyltransferase